MLGTLMTKAAELLAGVDPENIPSDLWGSIWEAYTSVFDPYGGVFFAFLIGVVSIVMYMKTENIGVVLVTILLAASLVSPFMGPFAKYFIITAGASLGVLIYYLIIERR